MQRDAIDLPIFSWEPPAAIVVPFPTVRRVSHLARGASYAARLSPDGCERWIAHATARHLERLLGLGVDPERARQDAEAYRHAVTLTAARLRP